MADTPHLKAKKRANEGRVVTDFEESFNFFEESKNVIKKMNSPDFGSITKRTVFIISLITATLVNVILDYFLTH